jgi:hypothetical protein
LRERENLEDIGVERRIILKLIIFRDRMGGGGDYLRIGAGDRHL